MPHAAAVAFTPARTSDIPSTSAPVGLLAATAAAPLVLWALAELGIDIPFGSWLSPALGLVAIVLVLVWLHGTFTALRGRTKFSPGMAVGGWFIPLANLFLPALILRDAWRASVGNGGGLAFVWMIAWWLTTAFALLRGLGLQFMSFDHGPVEVVLLGEPLFEIPRLSIGTVGFTWFLATIAASVTAYGLLALIVFRIGHGRA